MSAERAGGEAGVPGGGPGEGRAVFLSDVHISPDDPVKTAALISFLERTRAEGCARLFVLGDLFHVWVGRGQEEMPVYRDVLARLAALRAEGCEIVVVHGNRDFHIGEEVARVAGARIAAEGAVVRLGGRAVRVAHGDLLCRRDTRYQAMRRVIRSDALRRAFLALPLRVRLGVGGALRSGSAREVRRKVARVPGALALSAGAVRRIFQGGVDVAVVGHVHRAQRIAVEVLGRRRLLFVLGAWDEGEASWLEWRAGRFTLHGGAGGEEEVGEA